MSSKLPTRYLTLFRHAKSSWKYATDDCFRPLNKRGLQQGQQMALMQRQRLPNPDSILCSPASRTYATALFYVRHWQIPIQQLKLDWQLYEADSDDLLGCIAKQSAKVHDLWLFGHNPGLDDLLNMLCSGQASQSLLTSSVARIELSTHTWRLTAQTPSTLLFLQTPKNAIERL